MAHRYWRIRITRANATTLTAREIEFRSTFGGADLTGSGTAFASSFVVGTPPESAFDNDPLTWCNITASVDPGGMNEFIGYDFGEGNEVDIDEFTWTIGATAGRNPRDCYLEYSDDNVYWYEKWPFLNVASSASEGTTVYSIDADIEAQVTVTKTGFHIVQAQWGNERITVLKEGYQAILASFVEGVTVTKEGYHVILKLKDSVRASSPKAYAVFEQDFDARVSSPKAYVIFRPTPPPPRKTIVIIGPGESFGGSGQTVELVGPVTQEQEFGAVLRLPQPLSGAVEQESTVIGDLFVDDGTEDQFLEGAVSQVQTLSGAIIIPHSLSASVDQESEVLGDLFVDDSSENQFLAGGVSQSSSVAAGLSIAHRLAGEIEQLGGPAGDLYVEDSSTSHHLVGALEQDSDVEGGLTVTVSLGGAIVQVSQLDGSLKIGHLLSASIGQDGMVDGDLFVDETEPVNLSGSVSQTNDVLGSFGAVYYLKLSNIDELEEDEYLLLGGDEGPTARLILSGDENA